MGSAPKGAPVTDLYHGRNVNNPSKDTMWGEHWGGVIAKDGADTITLENYARNAEDPNYDQKTGADPRFYFQMYGSGAQSWHEKWAAVNAGQRSFVNPLTMTVSRPEVSDTLAAGHHEDRARLHFGDGAAVADDVPDVVNAASEEDMTIAAYKALAFARNAALSDIGPLGSSRTSSWTVAIMNAVGNFPGCRQLCLLTVDLLQQTATQRWKADALAEHGHQIEWIKDHHTLLASATAPVVVIKQLRKALAYAQDHVDNGRKGRKQRVRAWLDAGEGSAGIARHRRHESARRADADGREDVTSPAAGTDRLDLFLGCAELDDLSTLAVPHEDQTSDERARVAAALAGDDAQAVVNLLMHPDMLAPGARFDALAAALDDDAAYASLAAVVGLQDLDPSTLIEHQAAWVAQRLLGLCQHANRVIAERASVTLLTFADLAHLEALAALLESEHEVVRHNAVVAILELLGPSWTAQLLRRVVHDGSPSEATAELVRSTLVALDEVDADGSVSTLDVPLLSFIPNFVDW